MKYIDLSLPAPDANLALDEALLNRFEAGESDAVLRFWEPSTVFVVLGYSNVLRKEIREDECDRRGVPIFRRFSGGGTVVQGPGCLNYTLVFGHQQASSFEGVHDTNIFVLKRHAEALRRLGVPATVEGISDLAAGGRKVSGNAQRRRKRGVLMHGTFLLNDFDLSLIPALLAMPPLQPAYRAQRAHEDFVARLPVGADEMKAALKKVWNAAEPAEPPPAADWEPLIHTQYGNRAWNRKF